MVILRRMLESEVLIGMFSRWGKAVHGRGKGMARNKAYMSKQVNSWCQGNLTAKTDDSAVAIESPVAEHTFSE